MSNHSQSPNSYPHPLVTQIMLGRWVQKYLSYTPSTPSQFSIPFCHEVPTLSFSRPETAATSPARASEVAQNHWRHGGRSSAWETRREVQPRGGDVSSRFTTGGQLAGWVLWWKIPFKWIMTRGPSLWLRKTPTSDQLTNAFCWAMGLLFDSVCVKTGMIPYGNPYQAMTWKSLKNKNNVQNHSNMSIPFNSYIALFILGCWRTRTSLAKCVFAQSNPAWHSPPKSKNPWISTS